MTRENGRLCPVCSTEDAPVFRAVCGICWKDLPRPLAKRHQAAWRNRIRDPRGYGESLIAIYQWRRDKGAARGREAA